MALVTRRAHGLALVGVFAVALALVGGDAAAGPAVGETTTSVGPEVEGPDIVPEPNRGARPSEAGDRGGAAQLALAVGIAVALGVIATLAVRDARRSRRRSTTSG
jgi:hypothetical protein